VQKNTLEKLTIIFISTSSIVIVQITAQRYRDYLFLKHCSVLHCDNGRSLSKYNWQYVRQTAAKNSWFNWQFHLSIYDTSRLFTDSNVSQN